METKRNSNIEILRIISIIMIVISHYCVHGIGGEKIATLGFGINRYIYESLTIGNIGTILFVLISGYYLINSEKVKIKKLLKIIFQVVFYSSLIYIVLVLFKFNDFSLKEFIKVIFPISFKEYWFATAYIILYIFHPYINKFLNTLNRIEHLKFNCLLFIIFSLLQTITPNDYYGNELIQFLMFYSIGAYLFKYPKNILSNNNNNVKFLIISVATILLSILIMNILGQQFTVLNSHSRFLLARTSPFAILFCASLFDIFSRKKVYSNKVINLIASLVFGVYLISSGRFLAPIIWHDIFQNQNYISSPYLMIHIIVSVFLVTIICLIIEFFRKTFIEKPLFGKMDPVFDKLQLKIEKRFKKIELKK